WDEAGNMVGQATTDRAGQYRMWNLEPGAYMIRYALPEYVHWADNRHNSILEEAVNLIPGANAFPVPGLQHSAIQIGRAAAQLTSALGRTPMQP
ncbi:MAG: hypothetical protein KDE47_06555, partial [Caldilineaceae bacterium]|nr:hypothetical protein [Caldilineaceae bacterium]